MESILTYVKRRLRDVGPSRWEEIRAAAQALGPEVIAKSTPRKLVYDRSDTSVNTLEPFYRYFLATDYGLESLPHEEPPITKRNGAKKRGR